MSFQALLPRLHTRHVKKPINYLIQATRNYNVYEPLLQKRGGVMRTVLAFHFLRTWYKAIVPHANEEDCLPQAHVRRAGAFETKWAAPSTGSGADVHVAPDSQSSSSHQKTDAPATSQQPFWADHWQPSGEPTISSYSASKKSRRGQTRLRDGYPWFKPS
ncbi:hypothetical protein SERLA73DRAFT_175639 [Serpula lacrymans var. lacrymans S7.3]|uniref:Uncharacterized protein n=2 Tax=Serpula lacrymans var. lacrymans TaxID=341189 RepID=F8PL32_SERL3|nr:uncharacterized protein SERLADRAFT_458187 [Serpula lacrymans var. lacrymans S7.9]EGO03940.1 hypothetical protein SERLA73DRAFT_175639 [Serpula lacrymans var. lacrymans S7.3]EGO29861.1 hypothetical protein SERLADRAFT_458187 [Serpula lacrymans var. lacrymans S7.9]